MDAETLKQVEALRRTMEYYKTLADIQQERAEEAEALVRALKGELSKRITDVTYPAQVA